MNKSKFSLCGLCLLLFSLVNAQNTFTNSGPNVGIGTTSPEALLHVYGNAMIGTGLNGANNSLIIKGPNSPANSSSFQDINYKFTSAGSARIRSYRGGTWDTYLQFLTNHINAGSDNPQVRMHIDGSGLVGIGTTAPLYPLEVYWPTSQRIGMRVPNDGIQTASLGIRAGRDWTINTLPAGAAACAFTIKDESFGAERFRIDQNGNVGIGTSDPKEFKLAVNGAAIFTKVQVKAPSTPWPDYVFQPNYQLRSLASLEEYINQYNHLPDVPSAEEVEKNGNDLGATQSALLKKIEELTLYVIELNKKIQMLEERKEK